jgi:hypothetical protein
MKYLMLFILITTTNLLLATEVEMNPFGFCRYAESAPQKGDYYYFSKSLNGRCPQKGSVGYIRVDKLPDGFISKIITFVEKLMNSDEYNHEKFGSFIKTNKHSKSFFERVAKQFRENNNLEIKYIVLKYNERKGKQFFYTEVTVEGKEGAIFSIRLSDIEENFRIVGVSETID